MKEKKKKKQNKIHASRTSATQRKQWGKESEEETERQTKCKSNQENYGMAVIGCSICVGFIHRITIEFTPKPVKNSKKICEKKRKKQTNHDGISRTMNRVMTRVICMVVYVHAFRMR